MWKLAIEIAVHGFQYIRGFASNSLGTIISERALLSYPRLLRLSRSIQYLIILSHPPSPSPSTCDAAPVSVCSLHQSFPLRPKEWCCLPSVSAPILLRYELGRRHTFRQTL
jgi:hypothetical protein